MGPLEKRVMARMKTERTELHAEQRRLGRRRVDLLKRAQREMGSAESLFGELGRGVVLSDSREDASLHRLRLLAITARRIQEVNERMRDVAAALARLESSGEAERRLALAAQYGVGDEPVIGLEAAEIVLLHEGRPMPVRAITRRALEAGIVKLRGATPEQSMSGYLATAAQHGDRFVRVGPNTYDLKERASAQPS